MKTATQTIPFRYELTLDHFQLCVDASFPAKGVTAIFGHSGCGKSTLLRCIAGLEKPQQAFLSINNQTWDDSSRNFRLATHQRRVGYVFQEASLFQHLSVIKNLEFGVKRSKHSNSANQMAQAIELLDIETLLNRNTERLSGGERQRVAIARALAVCPDLLLMDEPLAALDMPKKREILPFLQRINHEMEIPVLYVSHSPAEVKKLADYLIVMEAGKIMVKGDLEEIQKYLLEDDYF
jgi:molybdate transport system ATP-binding protein